MLDKLIGCPLSGIDLRELYIRGNKINETKRNRATVTPKEICDWLQQEGYGLKKKRYYNYAKHCMSKYYLLIKL